MANKEHRLLRGGCPLGKWGEGGSGCLVVIGGEEDGEGFGFGEFGEVDGDFVDAREGELRWGEVGEGAGFELGVGGREDVEEEVLAVEGEGGVGWGLIDLRGGVGEDAPDDVSVAFGCDLVLNENAGAGEDFYSALPVLEVVFVRAIEIHDGELGEAGGRLADGGEVGVGV